MRAKRDGAGPGGSDEAVVSWRARSALRGRAQHTPESCQGHAWTAPSDPHLPRPRAQARAHRRAQRTPAPHLFARLWGDHADVDPRTVPGPRRTRAARAPKPTRYLPGGPDL